MTDVPRRATYSPDLLELVRRAYGFADLDDPVDLGGGYSLNLRVRADDRLLVVRVHRPWVQAGRLNALHFVRDFLSHRGFPFAPLLPTRDSCRWTRYGDRLVEVEEFVWSQAEMDTWHRLRLGMPTLASLHDHLRTMPVPPPARTALVANHVEASRVVEATATGVRAIRSWDPTTRESYFADVAACLASALSAVEQQFPARPRQLVHGDFWGNNVHFTGDRVVLITDLDFMGERPRIDDLAVTLFYANEHFGRERWREWLPRLAELVDLYDSASTAPLSSTERAALPYAILRAPLCFIEHMAFLGPAARTELVELRGPECEWALPVLTSPDWQEAFARPTRQST
ncbi:MAG TPA: phosphotransferase [Actinopolymorphaceae bacterium]|mgnify:CR=1 FL=1|jgi:Ser/Thr protein kinase RdoA (MazF antagonist)